MATRAVAVRRFYGRRPKPKHRRGKGFRVPLMVVGGLASGVLATRDQWLAYPDATKRTAMLAFKYAVENFTGFNTSTHSFEFTTFKKAGLPLVIGVGAHFLANKLGFNRMLSRAVPFVSI